MITAPSIFKHFAICSIGIFLVMTNLNAQRASNKPVRIAVAGITHGHVPWILDRHKDDVTIVGISEPDTSLWDQYSKRYRLNRSLFYSDLEKMLDAVKPDAVVAFGSINQHIVAVEACAPRG